MTTPLRAIDSEVRDGCRVLGTGRAAYLDGSEQRLYEALDRISDIGALSDELAAHVERWPDGYHLLPARANLLRALRLPPDAAVLEVGAGCGALTRHLGETVAAVDALEPVPERARVARRRTRDLVGVEVFVGAVEDVPDQPAYDVVLVVGVLEYIGGGARDGREQADFVGRLARLIRPGGALVLAIENRLGVKYVAGAPEDHTGRVYDSVEGYRGGSHARTLSRAALGALVEGAGLQPRFLGIFPDYKFTRAVLTDELFAAHAPLAWRIPAMPSPDWAGVRAHGIDEGALWRELVDGGLAGHFPNAFCVLATRDGDTSTLWPPGRLGAFYQLHRRARFATETTLDAGEGGTVFTRRLLAPQAAGPPVSIDPQGSTLVAGTDMVELLESADEASMRRLLRSWIELLDERLSAAGRPPVDLVPHNVVVRPDGGLGVIDQEWSAEGAGRTDIVARGALVTGIRLATTTPPRRWEAHTVEDVVRLVLAATGENLVPGWVAGAVRWEARFQAEVLLPVGPSAGGRAQVEALEDDIWRVLRTRLDDTPQGDRDHDRLARARAEAAALRDEVAERAQVIEEAEAAARLLRADLDEARATIAGVSASLSWQLTAPMRAASRGARRLLDRPHG